MNIISMAKSKANIIKKIAAYYLTTPDKIAIDMNGRVFVAGRKSRTQVAIYKNLFVFAFVK